PRKRRAAAMIRLIIVSLLWIGLSLGLQAWVIYGHADLEAQAKQAAGGAEVLQSMLEKQGGPLPSVGRSQIDAASGELSRRIRWSWLVLTFLPVAVGAVIYLRSRDRGATPPETDHADDDSDV
ncbi:MAG: hypothetical protein OER86_09010, partial [Phycisphaerae bacterium]|nr:hypothetical protein [Phycisphaerae bacterium]